ncbi:MAG: phenylalanine--tRNA ligase subunit beta [Alphaproteobacteria bacterium]
MKFPLGWLKEHLDTEASLDEICRTLTMIGLEVDSVVDRGARLAGFTVARVIAATPHPNADRLRVCTVDTGDHEVQVVCGAPNAREGLVGVFAPPGTYIPGSDFTLKDAEIRGVKSEGMLCSERELELSDSHEGIIELSPDCPIGAPYAKIAGLDDPIVEVGLTPNRGDCAGVRGIARDLAAAGLGVLKRAPGWDHAVPAAFESPVKVRIDLPADASTACAAFAGRYIRGVRNGPSPRWLQDRLRAVGLRPISALVDVTNFFTMDAARPLHVFDAKKLTGDIVVRLSKPGETLAALDNKTYTLSDGMTVVGDAAGAQALGGIIGGEASGCTEETIDVFLESAWFDPLRTAATGRRLGIHSDARYRFERGVDPESLRPGIEAATAMILDLCGGEASDVVFAGETPEWRRRATLRPERTTALAGLDVPRAEQVRILAALGCEPKDGADGRIETTPPSWRPDIDGEADLVEEVARIFGFDELEAVPLPRDANQPAPALNLAQARRVRARRTLAGRGMVEALTFSFMKRTDAERFGGGGQALALDNPISADLDAMRPSIVPNLLAAAARNFARAQRDGALFEVGPAYRDPSETGQDWVAAGVRWGDAVPRHWAGGRRPVDAFDAKADVLAVLAAIGAPTEAPVTPAAEPWQHPGRSAEIRLGRSLLARFGAIHPAVLKDYGIETPVVAFEVFLDAAPEPKRKAAGKTKPYLTLDALLPVERDFAFLVDADVPAQKAVAAARAADRQLVVAVEAFDAYQGKGMEPGRKSLGLAVTFQPKEATLTDAEIEALSAKVVEAVEKATGGTLRG